MKTPNLNKPINTKILGAGLTKTARAKKVSPRREDQEEAYLMEKWGQHLDGPKTIMDQADILGQVLDAELLIEEWLGSEEGFATEYLAIRNSETGAFEPLDLDLYQLQMLKSDAMYGFYKKARRIGLSYGTSVKALVRAHLSDGHDSYFVSKNNEEAKEKIKYALELWQTMPPDIRKPLASRGVTAKLEFASKTNGQTSRLISHPQTEPRGIQGDIYLDEFSSYL